MAGEIPLDEFLGEVEQIIDSLNTDLLGIDQATQGGRTGKPDPEIINNIFRAAHSLKGISGLFGFEEMTHLSHSLENMLDRLRLGKLKLAPAVLDLLFESVEALKSIVVAKGEAGDMPSHEALINRLNTIDDAAPAKEQDVLGPIGPEICSVLTEYEEHRLKENIGEGMSIFKLRAVLSLETFDEELHDLQQVAKQYGELITTLPCASDSSDEQIIFDVLVGSQYPISVFADVLTGRGIELSTLIPGKEKALAQALAQPEPAPAAPQKPRPEHHEETPEKQPEHEPVAASDDLGSIRSISQTVRVDIGKLDNLMNIVGELVLSKNIITQLVERLKSDMGFSEISMEMIKANRTLERKLSELQQGVLEVRMVPIGQIFDKLARNIRKLSREINKEIDFETLGSEVELDKLIIEELGDPLMHIIRNSIDHGIESRPERIQMGKPPKGLIKLAASQRGNHVVIEITDDGAGLNYRKIKEKAIERGLLDPHSEPRPEDLHEFLFTAGFSTADRVSEISGRGVGMDVVKSNISALSGAIDLESEQGQGTKVIITLPITLAIIQALIIEAGTETFAIPLNSVQESLAVKPEMIRTIEGREVIELRERTLPLLRLDRLFGLGPRNADRRGPEAEAEADPEEGPPELYVVKVGIAEKRLGIVVERLHGRQDIVIKSVGEMLKGIKGIAGATELGNQKTILVLDVVDLIEEASSSSYSAMITAAGRQKQNGARV